MKALRQMSFYQVLKQNVGNALRRHHSSTPIQTPDYPQRYGLRCREANQ